MVLTTRDRYYVNGWKEGNMYVGPSNGLFKAYCGRDVVTIPGNSSLYRIPPLS